MQDEIQTRDLVQSLSYPSSSATLSTPDKLIYDLASYINSNQSSNLENIHFYAFGGMKKTADWLNQLNSSELNYNSKNQFVL